MKPWICEHAKQVLVRPGTSLDDNTALCDLIWILPCPVPGCESGPKGDQLVAGNGMTYARNATSDGWRWAIQFS